MLIGADLSIDGVSSTGTEVRLTVPLTTLPLTSVPLVPAPIAERGE
jgi:hypothetical protein